MLWLMTNTFAALADPKRAKIIEALAGGERTAGELVALFSISQPAVSQHLRVLREAGLVVATREAQRRVYRLDPRPLRELDRWLGGYRRFWAGKLNDLERHMDKEES
jgi:DNA-binding transcriptional ArsR family regulator